MKSLYMQGGYYNEGTPVKICFEGKVTRGVLADSDSGRRLIGVKTPDSKIHWSHEIYVSIDRPEPVPRMRRSQF